MADKKHRIGFLGGTFDPIHNGHLSLARTARREYELDRLLIMPSGISYLKVNKGVSPAEDRYRMCTLACNGEEGFSVSDLEIRRSGNTYTCDTVEELKRQDPDAEHYFIVGADTLFYMENWKEPERIFRSCIIAAAVRDELGREALEEKIRELTGRFAARILILPVEPVDISSSMIREAVKSGRTIRGLVPEAVEEYISSRGLYAGEEQKRFPNIP